MVGPIPPATVVVGQQPINVAPVVNQPIGAPFVADHIAPAVVANNVAQKWSREDKSPAGIIGAEVVGGGCTVGATLVAVLKLAEMGASDAVVGAAGAGTGCVGLLRVAGSMFGIIAYYVKSTSK
ncbi:MAG: hypothetical protein OXF02_05720 [Simkaniaceae bacterium]|nr:hypothetical protein [Simkaniaceae bacterium]